MNTDHVSKKNECTDLATSTSFREFNTDSNVNFTALSILFSCLVFNSIQCSETSISDTSIDRPNLIFLHCHDQEWNYYILTFNYHFCYEI